VTVVALLQASVVMAQQPPGEPIEPGIEDRGPLSESLRIIQPGLAQPQHFEQIYRIIGPEGEMLMRASGGLYAVFPRSDYAFTEQGPLATVPPGTVFYIGSLPPQYLPKRQLGPLPEDLIVAERLDGRSGLPIDTQIDVESEGLPYERHPLGRLAVRAIIPPTWPDPHSPGDGADSSASQTIVNDEAYRAQRVRELMSMAAAAENERQAREAAGRDAISN
jgi:hypothetical protein